MNGALPGRSRRRFRAPETGVTQVILMVRGVRRTGSAAAWERARCEVPPQRAQIVGSCNEDLAQLSIAMHV